MLRVVDNAKNSPEEKDDHDSKVYQETRNT